ncbi:MAG: hypothetical protein WBD40_02070, partial [Tepidisphaeraceae bacterium]
ARRCKAADGIGGPGGWRVIVRDAASGGSGRATRFGFCSDARTSASTRTEEDRNFGQPDHRPHKTRRREGGAAPSGASNPRTDTRAQAPETHRLPLQRRGRRLSG